MPDRTCSVLTCLAEAHTAGFCRAHYTRWWKYGDPLHRPHPSAMERFWARFERAPDGCWLWTGPLYSNGYGEFNFDGRNRRAHRFAYDRLVGPIPDGLELDHLCRVRRCVNPAHLEPVTHEENVRRIPEHLRPRAGRKVQQ